MNKSKIIDIYILKHYFNFEIIDMGDFWIAKNNNIELIQPKNSIITSKLPFQIITKNRLILNFIKEINTISDMIYLIKLLKKYELE